ncbi:helix-turn-helix domain-containing protein [Bacillus sp. Xin]|uniref:helix-turn-helix domain-containing protein n=1 Tax=unclassified Bacillus (in: firmicutes) TaxID=185979 RepID=UPI0015720CBE|nr:MULTISPECIES: helix-turn-helix domain-containing protein [unclassified Bacillus (in: firmicutes)]MBC6971859.1 helix-turn-helix domain-containing protein [Bacillus sp. Xin]NSW39322.1 helix-turn-helix domain-containing protein [Bacillus sp. Xin1]
MIQNYFGENVRILRTLKGLSMKELGDVLGVASSTISNWENNRKEPNFEMLQKISIYFNTSTDRLLNNKIGDSEVLPTEDRKIIVERLAKDLYESYKSIPDKDKPLLENELIEYAKYLTHRIETKNKLKNN